MLINADTGKYQTYERNAERILDWIRNRGGIDVWDCTDPASPGRTWTTPHRTAEGRCVDKPHPSAGRCIRHITSTDDVEVLAPREAHRFHVAVHRDGETFRLTDAASQQLREALARAGPKAWHEFDYATQDAVILVPRETLTLTEWAARSSADPTVEPRLTREVKTRLFEQFLGRMVRRRRRLGPHDCAITFMEDDPRDQGPAQDLPPQQLWDRDEQGNVLVIKQRVVSATIFDHRSPTARDWPELVKRHEDFHGRYIQFAFCREFFYADLPDNTLFEEEARRIQQQREGFFRLSERPLPYMSRKGWRRAVEAGEWNPLHKVYQPAQARSAAEDMAFVLYDVWRLPPELDIHYRTLTFDGLKKPWECEGRVG